MQAPMISSPLKQTNEVDWVSPLKSYIRSSYGDDPEKYSEECNALDRLRQDMRGAAKDSAAGRDLLYRYYGQLELLDLRFPVDENHIKILFTWFDAFTHKPTSQHSLAFEKASIIFNISAVLSCLAAAQNRHEENGLKTAYHCFQAAAGMFTYINENFLHAPSTDLHHETVRTLISIMLGQAQEVFLERQIKDGKKPGLMAKLACQAAHLHSQAVEGVQENVTKAVFEKPWLLLTQTKASYLQSLAQYYQALTDAEVGQHGVAIGRLQVAEKLAKEAEKYARSFPSSCSANSNLGNDTGSTLVDIARKHISNVHEKIVEFNKDNDFIYHQPVSSEAALPAIAKVPAAKAITVSELYQGQDISRIIGPDIFQRIVPMSVTESASLYDEEKAKLLRAETERVDIADSEMAASLDYLKLPSSLNVLKGGADQEMTVDPEFQRWCGELADQPSFDDAFNKIRSDKEKVVGVLEQCSRQLDMEESVCEKMRSKYGGDWTQQPSSRLTTTLRSDVKNYLNAIKEAASSDTQLQTSLRQHESDFTEMQTAGAAGEADVLYQRGMILAGASKGKDTDRNLVEGDLLGDDFDSADSTVADQITRVEELMRKLNLVKRERQHTLKDLKEKVHTDDISQVLILNKKAITNQEHQLFKSELEKFKPYQTRLLQANHKQASVMKELTRTYGDLLQDKRVRAEQSKFETYSRQRNTVLTKYRRTFQAFNDLVAGLERAQSFYSEMRDTVEDLSQNVETFVNNRKSEGGELLASIEKRRNAGSGNAERERERLSELMDRMNVNNAAHRASSTQPIRPSPLQNIPSYSNQPYNPATSPPVASTFTAQRGMTSPGSYAPYARYPQPAPSPGMNGASAGAYNPNHYGPVSPPATQQYFPNQPQPQQQSQYTQHTHSGFTSPPPMQTPPHPYPSSGPYAAPPPPPGPPPAQAGYSYHNRQNAGPADPWAGLSGWK